MIFLFTEIDHPALLKALGNPEADHALAQQLFLIEEILSRHGVHWMQRTPQGLLSAFEAGDPANAALALQKEFQAREWEGFGKGKIRIALHAGEADPVGQSYVGPDVNHALKLLDAAWGDQTLLTVSAVHFVPLPPGGRLQDLGVHFLKDLSEPQNIYSLQHPDLEKTETQPLRSLQVYSQNFYPQSSPFLGREEEIKEITAWLLESPTRLVTLTGPGGFGKTRLALQSSAEMVERFKDGAYLVALAPLLSDDLMVGSIANVIKFFFFGPEDPKTQLFKHLKDREMLLIMDNFEHIIEGAQLVKEMLQATAHLKILATSRERLRVEGERVFEVKGLRYPQDPQSRDLESFSAVQLFLKNARRLRPDFSLKDGERGALLKICRLLEGMPLGLELSATWTSTLSLPEIAEKIESSSDFLATSMPHLPPRHRSLRSVFEYSWILLSEEQKKVLKAISIFRGGFSGEAARKIAGVTEKTLDYLKNKSLVRERTDGRFEVHELLKYYAKEKLFDDPAEKVKILDTHSVYFSHLLQSRLKGLFGPGRRKVLEELSAEIDNIREGWKRAVEKADEKEISGYLDGLFALYNPKGWSQEGAAAFQQAVEAVRDRYPKGAGQPAASTLLLARLLCRWADFEKNLGATHKARKLCQESLDLFRSASASRHAGFALVIMGEIHEIEGGKGEEYFTKGLRAFQQAKDKWGTAWALNHLGHAASRAGEYPRALKFIRQSLASSEGAKNIDEMASSYNLMGDILHELGRFEEARHYHQKGLSAYLESGDRRGTAWSFINVGREAEAMGDFAGARQMYQEGMAITRDLGDIRGLAWCDALLGLVDWASGDYQEAMTLYEEGLFLYRQVGDQRGEAWILDLLGNLKLARREDMEAESYYQQAYALLSKMGLNVPNKAWYAYHLGTVLLFRAEFQKAQGHFQNSLGFFQKLRDPLGQTAALIQLGEVECRREDYAKSRHWFRKAAHMALDFKLTPFLADLLVGLARLSKAEGDDQKATGLLMVALNHPTCRRQTKDQAVSFSMELKSNLTTQEMEGYAQWAKAADIEEVMENWLTEGRAAHSPQKAVKPKKRKKAKKPKARKKRK